MALLCSSVCRVLYKNKRGWEPFSDRTVCAYAPRCFLPRLLTGHLCHHSHPRRRRHRHRGETIQRGKSRVVNVTKFEKMVRFKLLSFTHPKKYGSCCRLGRETLNDRIPSTVGNGLRLVRQGLGFEHDLQRMKPAFSHCQLISDLHHAKSFE
jgi:hypothetical protein